MRATLTFSLTILVAISGVSQAQAQPGETLPNGVAAGDTTANSTVLWTRSTVPGPVTFEVAFTPLFFFPIAERTVEVTDAAKPVKVQIDGLLPGVRYFYRATNSAGDNTRGRFRTASLPRLWNWQTLRFGVGADWRGELKPYPAIKNADHRDLDFFVALGDTIYADFPSPALPVSQAQSLDEFRIKNNEVYSERFGRNYLVDLRQSTSILATIDDHEVTDDFAGGAHPLSDPRFDPTGDFINETNLYRNGLQAFQEFNPIAEQVYGSDGQAVTSGKPDLYRYQTYGAQAAVFLLDARSFRDTELPGVLNPLDPAEIAAFLARSFDIDPNTGLPLERRTMLSRTQLDRLKLDLLEAQSAGVTWKFVMVPEPIQNLGVLGAPDRFEGYAAERTELLQFIDESGINNVVFVAADIHGTLVNNLSYQLGPGFPQIPTNAFEVTTEAVAYDAPFGPTILDFAAAVPVGPGASLLDVFLQDLGLSDREGFDALPTGVKDLALQGLIDQQITPLGYDPIGLDNSPVNAQLMEGGYTAVHTYGWTEFEIGAFTQRLTVTTYGIEPYGIGEVDGSLADRRPRVISRFQVTPQ